MKRSWPRNDASQVPATLPLVRVIAMPADANPNGDIFGGWLLAQMDLAGGSLAARRAQGRCAAVAVDGMVFHEPVFVGDVVSFWTQVLRVGETSVSMRVSVEAERNGKVQKLTQAEVTYVAVELVDSIPRPVPIRP